MLALYVRLFKLGHADSQGGLCILERNNIRLAAVHVLKALREALVPFLELVVATHDGNFGSRATEVAQPA